MAGGIAKVAYPRWLRVPAVVLGPVGLPVVWLVVVVDAMRTGMGTRAQPLMVSATTAGDTPVSFARTEHDECVRIIDDPDHFLSIRALRQETEEARNDQSKENAFRQYRLDLYRVGVARPRRLDGPPSMLWRFWLLEAAVSFLDQRTNGRISQWADSGRHGRREQLSIPVDG